MGFQTGDYAAATEMWPDLARFRPVAQFGDRARRGL